MIIYSFNNLKGGVGKTLLSTLTSQFLAKLGARVLFLDNDKQGNASDFFQAQKDITLADLLNGKKTIHEVIQKTKYDNIDIISADMKLIDANLSVLKDSECEQYSILENALSEVDAQYQFCITDTPPDVNLSVFNVLAFAHEIIIVTTPDENSMSGVEEMINQIKIAREYNPGLQYRCIMNKFITCSDCYDYKKENYPFFSTNIHLATRETSVLLVKSLKNHISIFNLAKNSMFVREFKQFAYELLKLGKNEQKNVRKILKGDF